MDDAKTPTPTTDIRSEAAGNLAFLLSVIRCGEVLSPQEEANVKRVIAQLQAESAAQYERPDPLHGLTGPDDKPLYVIERAGHVASLRRALMVAINTVECASIDQHGTELPWYRGAKAALANTSG